MAKGPSKKSRRSVFDRFVKELVEGSNRTCVLLMHALLEQTIYSIVALSYPKKRTQKFLKYLKHNYNAGVELLYIVGMLPHGLYGDLNRFRKLRNDMAHDLSAPCGPEDFRGYGKSSKHPEEWDRARKKRSVIQLCSQLFMDLCEAEKRWSLRLAAGRHLAAMHQRRK